MPSIGHNPIPHFVAYIICPLMVYSTDHMQDGRIDYNEFVAMMQKGNVAGAGKKGLQNSFSIGFREALKL